MSHLHPTHLLCLLSLVLLMAESPAQTVDAYRQWLRSWTSSEATVRARCILAESRIRAWGVDGITTEHLEAWLSGYTGWSRATYYQNAKSFCTWLHLTGRLPANPTDDLRAPRAPKSLPRPLSADQVRAVLTDATGDERAWLLLGLYQGLRAAEIAKIRGDAIADGMLFVLGKGAKPAYLPVHTEIATLAAGYPAGFWFPGRVDGHISPNTVSTRVSRLFADHGIEGSLHRCRHSFGTNLVRNGVHVRKVQNLMRHESLATTAIYTALDSDELRDAINVLPSTYQETGTP
jgi:integrase/recombinase XerD